MRNIRFVAALMCVGALTACGGGGGGSSSGGGSGVNPPQSNISQQSVQRTDVQSGLSGLQAYQSYEGGGSLTGFTATRALTAAVRRNGRTVLSTRRRDGAAGCDDGVVEETPIDNSNGSITITINVYYDAACDNIESSLTWTASEVPSSDEVSGPATLIDYSTSGTVTETANATIAFYLNSQDELTGLSFLATSIVANNVSLGQAGIACNVPSLSSFSCGVAAATNIASSSLEDGANVSLSGSQTSTQLTVNMQISTYQGALNALSITAATFPDWTISPSADLLGSLSMSGTESASSTTVSLTMTDSTNNATLTMSGSAGGTITGTLTNNATGATVATFTVNAQGNGTVTYGNGSSASIVDYMVQG